MNAAKIVIYMSDIKKSSKLFSPMWNLITLRVNVEMILLMKYSTATLTNGLVSVFFHNWRYRRVYHTHKEGQSLSWTEWHAAHFCCLWQSSDTAVLACICQSAGGPSQKPCYPVARPFNPTPPMSPDTVPTSPAGWPNQTPTDGKWKCKYSLQPMLLRAPCSWQFLTCHTCYSLLSKP